jgi:hypothetical protein
MDPGTQRIIFDGRGKAVDLSQTVDGFTVSIQRVYADANQITIGYTISGPPGRTFNNFQLFGGYAGAPGRAPTATLPTLTDAHGHTFTARPTSWGAGVEDGLGAYLLRYDMAGVPGNPTELRLRLEATAIEAIEAIGPQTPSSMDGHACQPHDDEAGDPCVTLVHGSFTFDFTVPVEPSRIAELHQVVATGGTTITLERVVVAPTGTRVALRGVGPDALVELAVEDARYILRAEGAKSVQWTAASQWDYTSPAVLTEKYGTWTLVVTPGPPRNPTGSSIQGGPWTFHFVVP